MDTESESIFEDSKELRPKDRVDRAFFKLYTINKIVALISIIINGMGFISNVGVSIPLAIIYFISIWCSLGYMKSLISNKRE